MDLKVIFPTKDSYRFVVYHGYLNEKVGLAGAACKLPFSSVVSTEA